MGHILASGQLSTTSARTIYTVPSAATIQVNAFALTNTSGSAVAVTIGVVPAGAAVDGTHQVLTNYTLAAYDVLTHKDVLSVFDGILLDTGTLLSVTAGTANAVNFLLTGSLAA